MTTRQVVPHASRATHRVRAGLREVAATSQARRVQGRARESAKRRGGVAMMCAAPRARQCSIGRRRAA